MFEALTAPNPDGVIFAADLTGEPPAASGAVPEAAPAAPVAATNPQPPAPNPGEALAAYITLLRAQPDLIPELIGGATLDEVEASAAQARAAYAGTRERVLQAAQGAVPFAQAGTSPTTATAVRGFAAIAAGVRRVGG
jgi:hypothetical protein